MVKPSPFSSSQRYIHRNEKSQLYVTLVTMPPLDGVRPDAAWVTRGQSETDFARDVLRHHVIEGEAVDHPLADLSRATVVVGPVVEKIAPALVDLVAHAHAVGQLHEGVPQDNVFAQRLVLLDGRQPEDHRQDHAVRPPGLHGQYALIARLQGNDLRLRRKVAGGELVYRTDV